MGSSHVSIASPSDIAGGCAAGSQIRGTWVAGKIASPVDRNFNIWM